MRMAVKHIRRMHGGSQSHLMQCDDGHYYIVKFQNNPQHRHTLVNDLFATNLAARIGLSVPQAEVIYVAQDLIAYTDELKISLAASQLPCSPGRQFGSKYPCDPTLNLVSGLLPEKSLSQVVNIEDFTGILLFDKWTCNTDKRQAVFLREPANFERENDLAKYKAMMIDHGYCFNGKDWNFPDAPLFSLYFDRAV
jgi:hypothetical protein